MPPECSPLTSSRRAFLKNGTAAVVGALSALLTAAGCTGEEKEPETSATCYPSDVLPERSRKVRQALDYVPKTAIPAERCDNCRFYQMPTRGDRCGGCDHFSGPVTKDGWCNVWAPETT